VPVPHPLPAGDRAVRRARAGAASGRRRALRRLPPRGGRRPAAPRRHGAGGGRGVTTIAEILRGRRGDAKVGLRFEDREWTWDEIVQESSDRAAALLDTVPRPEGRQLHVGVLLDNVPDYVFW